MPQESRPRKPYFPWTVGQILEEGKIGSSDLNIPASEEGVGVHRITETPPLRPDLENINATSFEMPKIPFSVVGEAPLGSKNCTNPMYGSTAKQPAPGPDTDFSAEATIKIHVPEVCKIPSSEESQQTLMSPSKSYKEVTVSGLCGEQLGSVDTSGHIPKAIFTDLENSTIAEPLCFAMVGQFVKAGRV